MHERAARRDRAIARSRNAPTNLKKITRATHAEHSSRAANLPFNAPPDDDRRTFHRALLVEQHLRCSVLPQRDCSSPLLTTTEFALNQDSF